MAVCPAGSCPSPPAWGGQLPAGGSTAYQFGCFCRVAPALFFFFLDTFHGVLIVLWISPSWLCPGRDLGKAKSGVIQRAGGVVLSPPLLVSTAWKGLTVL